MESSTITGSNKRVLTRRFLPLLTATLTVWICSFILIRLIDKRKRV